MFWGDGDESGGDGGWFQDEYKMEKVSRRLELLETARNNVKLLHELLVHYEPNQGHDIVKVWRGIDARLT